MSGYLKIGEDNNVVLDECSNEYSGAYINDATVEAQVRETDETPVGSAVTMAYQSGTNGTYLGVISAGITGLLTRSELYYVDVTITSGLLEGFRRLERYAEYHRERP